MAVRGTVDVWTSGVDRAVNHVRCGVEQAALASINDLASMVDQDEIRLVDQRESNTEWIDPKAIGVNRISESNVAGDTLVEAILPEDAECGG